MSKQLWSDGLMVCDTYSLRLHRHTGKYSTFSTPPSAVRHVGMQICYISVGMIQKYCVRPTKSAPANEQMIIFAQIHAL